MACCAVEGCDRPECPVCSVPRRFPAPTVAPPAKKPAKKGR